MISLSPGGAGRTRGGRWRIVVATVGVPARVCEDLLEREEELAALAALIDRAASGASGALLVEGAAGIGKSRLLEAIGDLAFDQPVQVLRARGGELERSFPFGIAGQLFGETIAALNVEERASILSGAAELAVEVVSPVRLSGASSPEAVYPRLHGLYWLCAGLAGRQPLVLVVDDAQWADDVSLQWLLFMVRRLDEMPVTIVLGVRSDAVGDWPEALVLLGNEACAVVMRPMPLSEVAAERLIRRRLGADAEEAFCAACYRATGGNPYLLCELIASLHADGIGPVAANAGRVGSLAPEAIVRNVVVRLGRISRAAGALARGVAVLGAAAELRHAAALAGLDAAAASAAADALAAGGLLEAGRPLRLVHPVVRTALYSELAPGERAQLHRRAARMLAGEHADLDVVAAHLLASEPAGEAWAVDLLLDAAERAAARGSPAIAAGYLRRALTEPPTYGERAVVLHRLGLVETVLGQPIAAAHVGQALQLSRDPRRRGELAFDLSVACLVAGRAGDAIEALAQAIDQTEGDRELRWRLEAQLISVARMDPTTAERARRHLDRVPADLPGDSPGERLILAELASVAVLAGNPFEVVADLARRALGGGQLIAEQPRGSLSLLNAITALALTDQHDLAMSAYEELIARARREGSPISYALICSRRSQLHYLRGSIPDAIADAQAALDAGNHFGHSLLVPSLYGTLIDALLEAGEVAGADRALATCVPDGSIPATLAFFPLLHSRGRLRLAQGDTQAGIDDLLTAHELLAPFGITNPAGVHSRSSAAVALTRVGKRERARQLVAEELTAARRFGAPGTVGIALRAAGLIEGGATGIEYLREAEARLKRSPARLEHARGMAELGAALRRSGNRVEAQQWLRRALDLADRCGAKTVGEQAREELVITGARPRRSRMTGVEALTASERRVAQLAAQGLTNRQIAQALFVSHSTVVTHLSHCYQKLEVSSREQLAPALAQSAAAES